MKRVLPALLCATLGMSCIPYTDTNQVGKLRWSVPMRQSLIVPHGSGRAQTSSSKLYLGGERIGEGLFFCADGKHHVLDADTKAPRVPPHLGAATRRGETSSWHRAIDPTDGAWLETQWSPLSYDEASCCGDGSMAFISNESGIVTRIERTGDHAERTAVRRVKGAKNFPKPHCAKTDGTWAFTQVRVRDELDADLPPACSGAMVDLWVWPPKSAAPAYLGSQSVPRTCAADATEGDVTGESGKWRVTLRDNSVHDGQDVHACGSVDFSSP